MSQGGGGGLECYTGLKAAAAAAAPSQVRMEPSGTSLQLLNQSSPQSPLVA